MIKEEDYPLFIEGEVQLYKGESMISYNEATITLLKHINDKLSDMRNNLAIMEDVAVYFHDLKNKEKKLKNE